MKYVCMVVLYVYQISKMHLCNVTKTSLKILLKPKFVDVNQCRSNKICRQMIRGIHSALCKILKTWNLNV